MAEHRAKLLVIDDDRNFRETLCELLEDNGYLVRTASNGQEALALLQDEEADLTVCDWKMPGMNGEEFLRTVAVKGDTIRMPILIMTAYGTGPNALQAMQLGAYDFITKPLDMMKTLSTIERALRHVTLEKEVQQLRKMRFSGDTEFPGYLSAGEKSPLTMIGSSPIWIGVFKDIGKVARTDVGVLLLGESGTGKEMVARTIHENSGRREGPFVIVNCAALPAELLESELFGHERGSFTGALAQKTGKFEAAHRGTVFLDEIGELPLSLQPKLLRVLQEHTFERIGSTVQIKTDVRIIAATNRDLKEEVENKSFRQDLFYRLNTYAIRLPPLRERQSDIPALVHHFLERYASRNAGVLQGITQEALMALQQYAFPGNVRELEHLIDRAAVQASGRVLTKELIEQYLTTAPPAPESLDVLLSLPLRTALTALERMLIDRALEQSSGNKAEAARLLGINRRLLYEKLQMYRPN